MRYRDLPVVEDQPTHLVWLRRKPPGIDTREKSGVDGNATDLNYPPRKGELSYSI